MFRMVLESGGFWWREEEGLLGMLNQEDLLHWFGDFIFTGLPGSFLFIHFLTVFIITTIY